ncbi:mac1p [Saccharomyces arboricola H-6]|uniref:Mac1p n=1 Tax=Saccharomyces arboricola (strain H-6 / AS 2.3317 / CBS 10644) TaxID=1160507 RepID=J8PJZ2_SACAR|nr:mac1p [Saccharomyces arboricola H-6]
MIIFNGNKYACASCIRGHRSSTCRHSHRMLIKVRTRGRPSPMAIRDAILVDSTSQSMEYENGPQVEGNCCSGMNQQPILFVRAFAVRKARMINGKLHILMEEGCTVHEPKDISTFTGDGNKYITEMEFLRKHSPKVPATGTISPGSIKSSSSNEKKESNQIQADPVRHISNCCKKNKTYNSVSNDKVPSGEIFTPYGSLESASTLNDILQENYNATGTEAHESSETLTPQSISAASAPQSSDIASKVEILTHKGIFLSTQCSCKDESCPCVNCLIHRSEEELNSYIEQSGVPLTNMGEAQITDKMMDYLDDCKCSNKECVCPPDNCICDGCFSHSENVVPFEKFFFYGILNVRLTRKSQIKFKGKLVPSKYWWDFLKLQVPLMTDAQLELLDIHAWFQKLVSSYAPHLCNANTS